MRTTTPLLVLLLLLILGAFSQVLAFSTSPDCIRHIDSNYELRAVGDGRITLTNKSLRVAVLTVHGSGNSEYCAWSQSIFLRIVPLEQNEDDEEGEGVPKYIRVSPEEIKLSGQPYGYYIIEKNRLP